MNIHGPLRFRLLDSRFRGNDGCKLTRTRFDQTVTGLIRQDTEIHHRTRSTPATLHTGHNGSFASLRLRSFALTFPSYGTME